MTQAKPKVAFYWCASCGGCEETVVDLNENILGVVEAVDIVFWPCAMDFKYSDVEAFKDGEIAVTFINGAIRTDEQLHIAKLLRAKTQLLVVFGSCAHGGGIPGLANLTSKEEIFRTSYFESPTVVNPDSTVPLIKTEVDGLPAALPNFWDRVYTVDQVVDVDYYLPGCPPTSQLLADAVNAVLTGQLPEKGTVLAPKTALCDTCPRKATKTSDLRISKFYRPFEIEADPDRCFLEQGIICCGPATRSGCGEQCINGNMPCTGCFGPPPGVTDQGAKMLTAIGSLFSSKSRAEAQKLAAQILDPAGTFYRYSVPASLLSNKR